jgi:acetyltransferase-like isoleucine patch superfamily enzyme
VWCGILINGYEPDWLPRSQEVALLFERTVYNLLPEIMHLGGVEIYPQVMVLAGASIGSGTRIQSFSVIESGAVIGRDCTIRARTTVIGNVRMGDNVFVGSGVEFIDRRYPRNNHPEDPVEKTYIQNDVVLGVNSTIFPVTVGRGSIIGAASLILKDVPAGMKVCGTWKGTR